MALSLSPPHPHPPAAVPGVRAHSNFLDVLFRFSIESGKLQVNELETRLLNQSYRPFTGTELTKQDIGCIACDSAGIALL